MSTSKKDKQAPATASEVTPAPAPDAEPKEEDASERDLLGSGAAGAAVGGLLGGAGGAALGGMLGLTGGALREGGKKKRRSWY